MDKKILTGEYKMIKIIIAVNDGEVSIISKPDYIKVEVRDYVDIDDNENYPEIHKDEDGDTYRVFSFPAKEKEPNKSEDI